MRSDFSAPASWRRTTFCPVLWNGVRRICVGWIAAATLASFAAAQPPIGLVENRLAYAASDRGDRIPDFSTAGYARGAAPLPAPPIVAVIQPSGGDDTRRIQLALEQAGQREPDAAGLRGTVLLAPGAFQIAGQLRIERSGVALRGSGAAPGGTELRAVGLDRRTLIEVGPTATDAKSYMLNASLPPVSAAKDTVWQVADAYVPVGSRRVTLPATPTLAPGDDVVVERPSVKAWIAAIGADAFGVGWREGSRNILWRRRIEAVSEGEGGRQVVTLDAPLTCALDAQWGGGFVRRAPPERRLTNVGVENMALFSVSSRGNPLDEEHAWFGVVVDDAENAWIRDLRFNGFAGGAVALLDGCQATTVVDCLSEAPRSEIGGYRRRTFLTHGQQTLFLRCWSEEGIQDFCVGRCAAGPNAFVNCFAARAHGPSGPAESWATGVLYDNVRIDGAALRLENLWSSPPGCGWAAANCVLWQCQAAEMRCFAPPGANNWIVGFWARPFGDASYAGEGDFVRPLSLFAQQTHERYGPEAAQRVGPFLLDPQAATNPTLEEALAFVERSRGPGKTLEGLIRERHVAAQIAAQQELETHEPLVLNAAAANPTHDPGAKRIKLVSQSGWLTLGDGVALGKHFSPTWWRGSTEPREARPFGPGVTRFMPARTGPGHTDDLRFAVDALVGAGYALYDHHYGLWYDRRRDDHLMVRRSSGEVAPPFYEQPFARTGAGTAWDGLSKYDLTKFNPWYWSRLTDLAQLGSQRGLTLMHQHYFQHNVLEAGAHWVDCPWRPANNVNDVGLPEPPPFIGDKRLFMAQHFYNVENPRLRELHRNYIRKCLDNFAEADNVLHMTSDEYSGPREFVEFWIDVARSWERETGNDAKIALSCPKNVQDAVLADPERRSAIDVIDIRYWTYLQDGSLYAPEGGRHLAPRQHLRQQRPRNAAFASILRSVREYRLKFPDIPVTYHAGMYCPAPVDGWAVLMGGGSFPATPPLPPELRRAITAMTPVELPALEQAGVYQLRAPDGSALLYCSSLDGELPLPAGEEPHPESMRWHIRWFDRETGEVVDTEAAAAAVARRHHVAWIVPQPIADRN
ncbi:MAG: hypothetical protein KDA61_04530 [Planctomycetales bacterium]|nr:hypothetical protein [Planctomycetales bacterium]